MMRTIRYQFFDVLDSTNDELKRQAQQRADEWLVVSAVKQTKGRGRSGNQWEMEPGASIATSLLLRPDLPMEKASSLTLVAAIAVCRAIEGLYHLETKIKWPNDVIYGGRKLCGILTEAAASGGRPEYVVVGIGVNVTQERFSSGIKDKGISLKMALEAEESQVSLEQDATEILTERIWQEFSVLYDVFLMTEDLSVLLEEYNRHLVNRNEAVRVLDPAGAWEGIARGIKETGELLVETEDDLRTVDSGEVSVRGVYGYV